MSLEIQEFIEDLEKMSLKSHRSKHGILNDDSQWCSVMIKLQNSLFTKYLDVFVFCLFMTFCLFDKSFVRQKIIFDEKFCPTNFCIIKSIRGFHFYFCLTWYSSFCFFVLKLLLTSNWNLLRSKLAHMRSRFWIFLETYLSFAVMLLQNLHYDILISMILSFFNTNELWTWNDLCFLDFLVIAHHCFILHHLLCSLLEMLLKCIVFGGI